MEDIHNQFGGKTARDLAMAKAKFANAVLGLSSKKKKTLDLAVEAYVELGEALDKHLEDLYKENNK